MALVVEDGTGLSNAESYISVADADIYVTNFKGTNAIWDAATTAVKEVAARVSTQYLDDGYAWIGEPETSTQALAWPRNYVYNELGEAVDGIPQKLKDACAEVMFLHVTGTSLTANTGVNDKIVKREALEGVGSKEYFEVYEAQPSFPVVNRLVSDYYESSARVDRA